MQYKRLQRALQIWKIPCFPPVCNPNLSSFPSSLTALTPLHLKRAEVLHEAEGQEWEQAERDEVYRPALEDGGKERRRLRKSAEQISRKGRVKDAATKAHQCHRNFNHLEDQRCRCARKNLECVSARYHSWSAFLFNVFLPAKSATSDRQGRDDHADNNIRVRTYIQLWSWLTDHSASLLKC